MTGLPDVPKGGEVHPERALSSEQFELVIRRAAELQARAAEDAGSAMTEDEVLRIGRELGLSGQHLNQALAEIRDSAPPEHGLLTSWLGEAALQASRTVQIEADEVRRIVESYLVNQEFMTVLRRFADRLVFERGTGVAAVLGRATSQFTRRTAPLKLARLEVAVRPLENGYSYVTLATTCAGPRAGIAAGGALGGGALSGFVAVALGIAIAPPAALLALPILGGSLYGARVGYEHLAHDAQVQLESFLDRLEHGDLQAGRGPRMP